MKQKKRGTNPLPISLLKRREVEAHIVVPLANAFIREVGMESTFEILSDVIADIARESGARIAGEMGGNSIEHLANGIVAWTEEDALDITVNEQNESVFSFDVTRCRFAEIYREMDIPPELGYILSCSRDFALLEGFNPAITLRRTQTIMEGAPYCDFCYRLRRR